MTWNDTRMRHVVRRLHVMRTTPTLAVIARNARARRTGAPAARTGRCVAATWGRLGSVTDDVVAESDRPLGRSISLLTDGEAFELARDILTGRVFIAAGREDLQAFMMVTAFMSSVPVNLGALWESMDKRMSMSLNGLPLFTSAHMVAVESLPLVQQKMDELRPVLFPS